MALAMATSNACTHGTRLYHSSCFCPVSLAFTQLRFVESTRRWEFEHAPLANYVNFQLTAAGLSLVCRPRYWASLTRTVTVAAIVGSDIAPTCVAVMKRKRLLVALLLYTAMDAQSYWAILYILTHLNAATLFQ